MKQYTLAELEAMKTLSVGQTDNLKIEQPKIRVWLARTTVADGEPYNNRVTVESLVKGVWKTIAAYQAK